MTRAARCLTILAASLASSAAVAQQPPPGPDDQAIVVTGGKMSKQAVRDFVRDLTPVTSGKGLRHFEEDVCPKVIGLSPRQNDSVANRIRLVAKTAGIDVGKPKCSPNVILIIASDKKAIMEELRRRHPDYYGDVSGNRIRELIRSPETVVTWQIEGALMNADGRVIPQNAGRFENYTTARASRLTTGERPQFGASVTIISFDALDGLTPTQLADYVAVRSLTGADPAKLRSSTAPTILRAFDTPFGGEVPVTLTEWDLNFLRGYYAARRNLTAAAQRGTIAKGMTDDRKSPQGQ